MFQQEFLQIKAEIKISSINVLNKCIKIMKKFQQLCQLGIISRNKIHIHTCNQIFVRKIRKLEIKRKVFVIMRRPRNFLSAVKFV